MKGVGNKGSNSLWHRPISGWFTSSIGWHGKLQGDEKKTKCMGLYDEEGGIDFV